MVIVFCKNWHDFLCRLHIQIEKIDGKCHGCLIYFPWLFASFYYKSWGLDNYWSEAPEWKDMFWTVLFYLNGNRILWYICLLTGAFLVGRALYVMRKRDAKETTGALLAAFCVAVTGWMIGFVFVFSKYIYPEGGLFVERYFTVILIRRM